MHILKSVLFTLLLAIGLNAKAADLIGVSDIFKSTFWTDHYEERFCRENIIRLVQKSINKGLDLRDAQIVEITDDSSFMFGMVNAVNVREGGRLIVPSQHSPSRLPGVKNWYYHVVLLVEGKILDYDFTNMPKVATGKKYFEEMFIPQDRLKDIEYWTRKMRRYQLKFYPAEEYVFRRNQRLSTQDISKTYYLNEYLP